MLTRLNPEVPGARTKDEFFAGLRRGQGRVAGSSGTYAKMNRDVLRIAVAMMSEKPWSCLLAPLLAVVPLVTLANLAIECAFAKKWSGRVLESTEAPELNVRSAQSQESVA